VKEVAAVFE
jgi:hypothetical protein